MRYDMLSMVLMMVAACVGVGYNTAEDKIRALLARLNLQADPWGVGNSKTGSPNSYRPFGPDGNGTCAASCPYHRDGTCYAEHGHCGMAARRATGELERSLLAACAVIVLAAVYGKIARLHTSGDAYRPGKQALDREYLAGLATVLATLREIGYAPVVGTYTHLVGKDFAEYKAWALEHGVTLWASDRWVPGGAVVVEPGTSAREVRKRNPSLHLITCPAQVKGSGVTCDRCRACYRPAMNQAATVMFIRH